MEKLCYLSGALKIAKENAKIDQGEKVVIVADYKMEKVAKLIATASETCGADTVIMFMSPRLWDCQEPPESIASAMEKADVIFTPVSVSIAWTSAMRNALKNGARALLMTAYTEDVFLSEALLKTDFSSQEEICNKLAVRYSQAQIVHLTTADGTDFSFKIGGKKVNVVSRIVKSGELGSSPNIEINVVPLEGTSQGKLVVDGSIPYLGIGVLDKPIEINVENGFITKIKQDSLQAKTLSDNLKAFCDNNVYNIAEFGVGLNPNAKLCGVMLEDEGVFGTIHIGIGTSISLGGNVDAPIHYDLILKNVHVELDGKPIQDSRMLYI